MRKSYISDKIKWNFSKSEAVSIHLHGYTIRMLTQHMEKKMWILNAVFYWVGVNSSCNGTYFKSHQTILRRWMRHAGHCRWSKEKHIGDVVLWTAIHRCAAVGRSAWTCIHQLCADTWCSLEDLPRAMDDRNVYWYWRRFMDMYCVTHKSIYIYIYIYIYIIIIIIIISIDSIDILK